MKYRCKHCGGELQRNGTKVLSNGVRRQRLTCKQCRRSDVTTIAPSSINNDSLQSRMSLKEVAKTWRTGPHQGSCQMVIPKSLAQKVGIYEPSQVVIEAIENDSALVIRKLEIA